MKIPQNILVLLLALLLVGCGGEKKQTGLLTVDVTKTYPKKEIVLQDIANVEYIPLETRDDVLIDRIFTVGYASKDTIMIANRRQGDVFIFNGQGKFLHSFNHRGQGADEYINIFRFTYNVPTQEIFIYTSHRGKRGILVYSVEGKFKRKFSIATDILAPLRNFDEKTLIGYETTKFYEKKQNTMPLFFISKETGLVDTIKSFKVPDRKSDDIFKTENGVYNGIAFITSNISKINDDFVVDDLFADTIYSFHKNKKLQPILVKQPQIKEMGDTPTIVNLQKVTDKYFFIYTEIYKFQKPNDRKRDFLCVDRTNNEIVTYTLRNKDIQDEEFKVYPYSKFLNAADLVELLEDGKLSGKLKEIAENLQEDDNPVWIKIIYKKE